MHFQIAIPDDLDLDELDFAAETILVQQHGQLPGVITGTVKTPGHEYLVRDERERRPEGFTGGKVAPMAPGSPSCAFVSSKDYHAPTRSVINKQRPFDVVLLRPEIISAISRSPCLCKPPVWSHCMIIMQCHPSASWV